MEALFKYIDDQVSQLNAPGISLCLKCSDRTESYNKGYADLSAKTIVNDDTVFDIASIGKIITAVLVLRLVEKGKLRLDTPISLLLSGTPKEWKEIQVSHLLTHTSGLGEYTSTSIYWEECQKDVPKNRILEYVTKMPLQFLPGSRWDYNNTGYFLLGLIIEEITNADYFDHALELINSFGINGIIKTQRHFRELKKSTGYNYINRRFDEVEYYSSSGTFSSGGFSSTMVGFIQFESLLFEAQILSRRTLDILLSTVFLNSQSFKTVHPYLDFEMCHGIFQFSKFGKKIFAHGGATKGFSATYIRVVEDDIAMIAAANVSDLSDDLLKLLFRIYEKYTS